MKRFLQFIGLLAVIGGVGYGILYLKSNSEAFNEVLRIFGLVSAIALIGLLIARLIWGKNWILNGGATMLIGSDLIGVFKQLLDELPTPSKATTANLAGHVVYRYTRLGVLGFFLALIPMVLLWQQNQLLHTQNEKLEDQTLLFEKQNKKIDNQIQLEESNRRGALIVMMSNIMDKVDEELKDDWNDDNIRNLSPQLIGRIVALSQSFRPYRFLQDSMLIEKPLSPERGQLLLALVNSKLDELTYDDLFIKASFAEADLEKANLRGLKLSKIDLKGANLKLADLSRSTLFHSRLNETNLEETIFNGADLYETDLQRANIESTKFYHADITNIRLQDAFLKNVHFRHATLSHVNFNQPFINVDFRQANIENCEFYFCYFENGDFRNAILKENDIHEITLDSVKVGKKDWLDNLSNSHFKSSEEVTLTHYMNSGTFVDNQRDTFFLVHPNSKEGGAAQ